MAECTVQTASSGDVPAICALFDEVVSEHPAYISHSELQMGIATTPTDLSSERMNIWRSEVSRLVLAAASREAVVKILRVDGSMEGFVLCELHGVGRARHCIIGDACIRESFRGHGFGAELVRQALKDCVELGANAAFLESGLSNHTVHKMVEGAGFIPVSKVFWRPLSPDDKL